MRFFLFLKYIDTTTVVAKTMKRSRVGRILKSLFQSKKQRKNEKNDEKNVNNSTSSYYETWEKGDQIGRGGNGEVYVASFQSKEPVAMKCISKHKLRSEDKQHRLKTEIEVHRSLDHPNIVKFLDYFESPSYVHLVLELCDRSSLKEVLKKDFRFSESRTLLYLDDMSKAISYIHDRLIVHRDIKLANFVIGASSNKEREVVKLCDFGLCYPLSHFKERRNSFVGTPNFISPDVLRANKTDLKNVFSDNGHNDDETKERGYSFATDMWSLGVCVYLMMVGRPPFEGDGVYDTYQRIIYNRWMFPKFMEYNEKTRTIISNLLCQEEERRWTIKDLESFLRTPVSTPLLNPASPYDEMSSITHTIHSGESISSLSMFGCLDHSFKGRK